MLVFAFLPDSPTRARWADDELKTKLVERLRSNNQGIKQKIWKNDQAWETANDSQVYALFALTFCQTLVIGGVGKFAPLLINRSFGFDVGDSRQSCHRYCRCDTDMSRAAQDPRLCYRSDHLLLNGVPPAKIRANIPDDDRIHLHEYDRNNRDCLCSTNRQQSCGSFGRLPPSAILWRMQHGNFGCPQSSEYPISTSISVALTDIQNIAGQTKKSIAYATTFMAWGAGNAVSPQLLWNTWAPRYVNTLYIHLGLYAVYIPLAFATRTMLIRRNAAKLKARQGEPEQNLHAFEDLTDIQNPDYKYSI